MDYKELAVFSIVLGALGILDLVYFVNLLVSERKASRKVLTIVNTQLLTIIIGYIGVEATSVYVYYTIDDIALILDASPETKLVNNLTFFFIALVQSTYIHHSWLRAETILYYKNKVWYKIFRVVLIVADVIIFLPTVFKALSFILKMQSFHLLALYVNSVVGVIIFVFDCFIIYSFSKFFLIGTSKDPGHFLIAKYGIIASIGVLLTTISLGTSVLISGKSKSTANVFSGLTFLFFQMPIIAFIGLKIALEVNRKSDKVVQSEPAVETSQFAQ